MGEGINKLWPIERRVLAYLDQRGGRARRENVVLDLASPGSRIGAGHLNGTNAGMPRIMGAWCRRLIKAGMVRQINTPEGWYSHHSITAAGSSRLRAETGKEGER